MLRIFNKEYPIGNIEFRLIATVVTSLFVFLFLWILEPFHLNRLTSPYKPLIMAGYGLICLIVLLLFYVLLPLLLKKLFDDRNWRVYKEILWQSFHLILIGFVITIYEALIGTRPLDWIGVYETIAKTFVIGFIPITVLTYVNQIRLLKKHLNEAIVINESIDHKKGLENEQREAQLVNIESDNKKESFDCEIQNILFIASLGNYVQFFEERENKVNKATLRATISSIERQLSAYPDILRCHRSYLVNVKRISRIEGNARGIEICFESTDQTIPVSRRKIAVFKALING